MMKVAMNIRMLLATIVLLFSFIEISKATPYSAAQFRDLVAAKYLSAIKNYNDILTSMINQLKDYNPETTLPKPIDPTTTAATDNFVADLTAASQNAESMSKSLDKQVEETSAKVSGVESQIQAQQAKIATTQVLVQQKQQEITLANQRVNNANANVATFEDAVRRAEKRKEKAKCHCFRRRRKRGFLKSLERKIRCGIKGPICKVVNAITRDLKKAKKDLKKARRNLGDARAHLQKATADKNTASSQHAAAKAEVARLTKEKEQLMVTLNDAKSKRDGLVDVSAKMKRTLASVNELKGHGHVLQTNIDLGYLLDVESIATPLREVGQRVATINGSPGQAGFLPSLTAAQIAEMKQKLNVISKNKEATTVPTTVPTVASTTPPKATTSASTPPKTSSAAPVASSTAKPTVSGSGDLSKYVEKVDLADILGGTSSL